MRKAGVEMICIDKWTVDRIPFLYCYPDHLKNKIAPAVFILHGVTNAKEDNLHYAYLLAEKGFKVFLPDALYHGERAVGENKMQEFFDIIQASILELARLKDYLCENAFIDENRIIVGGISMGAITTFAALTQYDWIKEAFSMMGDPALVQLAQRQYQLLSKKERQALGTNEQYEQALAQISHLDLSLQPEKLGQRHLFAWHGNQDIVVPMQGITNFIKENNLLSKGQVTLVLEKNRGHKVSTKGVRQLVAWLDSEK